MALMTRIQGWRKAPKPVEKPKPTGDDRQAAIDALAKLNAEREQVDTLQATADELRIERDAAKKASDAALDAYNVAQSRASNLAASIDARSRRQQNVLRRTCSPAIDEFLETICALQRDLREDGIRRSAAPSGKYTVDGHTHKQPWSTFTAASERAKALVAARREAEGLRSSPLGEAEVESKLQDLFDALPVVDYQQCT